MEPNKILNPNKKRFVYVYVAIIIFVLVLVVTIVSLQLMNKGAESKNQSKYYSGDIIELFSKSSDNKALANSLYLNQPSIDKIIYKLDGRNYRIDIQSSKSVIYYAKNKTQSDDIKNVQDQTTLFMKNKSFSLLDSINKDANDELTYLTYKNDITLCQLKSSPAQTPAESLRFHALSCVSLKDIEKEYDEIEKQISIYKVANESIDFSSAERFTDSKDSVSYSTLFLTSNDKVYNLLFAAVDDNWEYLGDLNSGDSSYSKAKYTITPDLNDKIRNPKYKGFLTKIFSS